MTPRTSRKRNLIEKSILRTLTELKMLIKLKKALTNLTTLTELKMMKMKTLT